MEHYDGEIVRIQIRWFHAFLKGIFAGAAGMFTQHGGFTRNTYETVGLNSTAQAQSNARLDTPLLERKYTRTSLEKGICMSPQRDRVASIEGGCLEFLHLVRGDEKIPEENKRCTESKACPNRV